MGVNDAAEQLEAAIAECVRLEREVAARDAVIANMRRVVFDPHADYYGEIRVQFDALAESPEFTLSRVITEAKAEARAKGHQIPLGEYWALWEAGK